MDWNVSKLTLKTAVVLAFAVSLATTSCTKNSDTDNVLYRSLHFVREGSGEIDFDIYPTDSPDRIKILVSKYQFRDTTLQLTVDNSTENAAAFTSFHQALVSQVPLHGDFKQSTLPTGTWVYIYAVSDDKESEVTNTELRNVLLRFEQLTRSMIR